MSFNHTFRHVIHHLKQNGLIGTAAAVPGYLRRSATTAVEGMPGHFAAQQFYLRRRYEEASIKPIWVSPNEITGLTGEYELRDDGHLDYVPHFKPREAGWASIPYEKEVPYGTTLEGDWDQKAPDFSELLLYRGVRQHYEENLEWQDTVYYTALVEQFCNRGWDSKDAEKKAQRRCKKIDCIYNRVRADGYRSQRELNGHPLHEVTVTVGRDGQILYNCEGRHRLSVAKILDIEAIPVLVLVRHEEFEGTINSKRVEETKS